MRTSGWILRRCSAIGGALAKLMVLTLVAVPLLALSVAKPERILLQIWHSDLPFELQIQSLNGACTYRTSLRTDLVGVKTRSALAGREFSRTGTLSGVRWQQVLASIGKVIEGQSEEERAFRYSKYHPVMIRIEARFGVIKTAIGNHDDDAKVIGSLLGELVDWQYTDETFEHLLSTM